MPRTRCKDGFAAVRLMRRRPQYSVTLYYMKDKSLDVVYIAMGWDGIYCWYWCRHRSKVCSKAHRLPSAALPPLWSAGLFQKANFPTVTCVQTSSHRPERPTILQYSDFQKVVARVHRSRKLLKSTEGGSCSSPQKEEAAQVHRRRKLLESTEGGSC